MARLAKHRVHAVYNRAHELLLSTANSRGILSKKRVARVSASLEGLEREFFGMYSRMVWHRATGLTGVAEASATNTYAKARMVDAYDTNKNGLALDELMETSRTTRLAAAIALSRPPRTSGPAASQTAQRKAAQFSTQIHRMVADHVHGDHASPAVAARLATATWEQADVPNAFAGTAHTAIATRDIFHGTVYVLFDANERPTQIAYDSIYGNFRRPIRDESVMLREAKKSSISTLVRAMKSNQSGPRFDDLGSESDGPIEIVRYPYGKAKAVTAAVATAVGFDIPTSAKTDVPVFRPAPHVLGRFVDGNVTYGSRTEGKRADRLALLMTANLTDIHVMVTGADPGEEAVHEAFVLGKASDGSLIGFKSSVVWT